MRGFCGIEQQKLPFPCVCICQFSFSLGCFLYLNKENKHTLVVTIIALFCPLNHAE